MSALRELQRTCYAAFVHGRTEALLASIDGPHPEAAIRIYQNNALELFRKTLATTYPAVLRLTGEACFRTLGRDYMRAHPSTSGNLERFGAAFADFLDDLYHDTPYDYLADVARLEWACEQAFTAPDAQPVAFDALAELPEASLGALRFTLHASCRIVRSRYPVFSIWRANTESTVETVNLSAGPQVVLVSRSTDTPDLRVLPAAVAAFVESLATRETLATACERAAAFDAGFDPGVALAQLAAWRLLAGVTLPTTPEAPHHDHNRN